MRESDNSRMFSRIASRYDLLNHLLSFNIDRLWRRRAVAEAAPPSGGRVLDACAGTGDVAIDFVRFTDASVVVAVDLSTEMMQIGRGKSPNLRIQWVEGNVMNLPFEDGLFDAVTVAFGIRNLTDYQRGVAEMARVLKPGGRLVILEFAPPANGFLQKVYGIYLRAAVPAIGALVVGDGGAYRYLASSVEGFLARDRVLELMGAVGLGGLRARSLTSGIAYIYSGIK
ncbi:MAG: bifunctional demethylmenaquinone methyltransferase/2-methoxy-6-polyprenyl-1,4-benzoquinol methylase UbiE [bacterium]